MKALTSGDCRGRIHRDTGKTQPHKGNRQVGVRRGRHWSGKVKGAGHLLLGLQRGTHQHQEMERMGPCKGQGLVGIGFEVLHICPRHLWIGVEGHADCTSSTKPLIASGSH